MPGRTYPDANGQDQHGHLGGHLRDSAPTDVRLRPVVAILGGVTNCIRSGISRLGRPSKSPVALRGGLRAEQAARLGDLRRHDDIGAFVHRFRVSGKKEKKKEIFF